MQRAVTDRPRGASSKYSRRKAAASTAGKATRTPHAVGDEAFRLLVEAVKDYAIFMLDLDGVVVSWNPGAERIKGYAASEIIGKHFSTFYTAEDQARQWPAHVLSEAVSEGRCEDEGWRVRKDGTRFWADVIVSAVYDRNGRLTGFAKVTRDLTARQDMAALKQRGDHLHEFLAVLSHELRNPLAAITSALNVLQNAATPVSEHAQVTGIIERQMAHLTRLVDDLLDLSRLSCGKIALRKEVCDLKRLCAQAIEICQPLINARAHTTELRLASEPLPVAVDPTRIIQVVANLITNATKYTPPGGTIRVAVGREKDEAVLRVADTGVGIPAKLVPRVFDLFVQANRPLDRPEGGLGIGLTLVKHLVEMHGGAVSVTSELNRGSEFVVRLPVLTQRALAKTAVAHDAGPSPIRSRRRLLVVDDNRDFATTLAALLTLAGHEVRVVNDGITAYSLATSYKPDAMLLDIGLPGTNGYDLALQLRRSPEIAGATLIALTGYGQEADVQRARAAGFDAHLVKPIEAAELLRVIDQVKH